jgi:hypothetical protein
MSSQKCYLPDSSFSGFPAVDRAGITFYVVSIKIEQNLMQNHVDLYYKRLGTNTMKCFMLLV